MSKDPYQYFRTEARELVEGLTQGALELEKGRGDKDLVARLLRYAHTLKGASRIVKQVRVSELSHAIEEILAPYRQDPAGISGDDIRQIFSRIDEIAADLARLESPPAKEQPAPVQSRQDASRADRAELPEERFEGLRVDTAEMDALLRGMAELRVHLSDLEHQAQAIGTLEPLAARTESAGSSLAAVQQAIQTSLGRTRRELGQLHEQASAMRLVPASAVFGMLERAVRDAADETGKRVEFVATGGDTRLDAHGLSLLRNALLHVVRNAVAHGIEKPSERQAVGKGPAGRVQLGVERRGDRAVFTCGDDGRGIDLDRVRQVLLSQNLLTPSEAMALTAEAAAGMLLRGGISTTRRVTQLSGRGIGLDVVRQAVTTLKGTTTVRTQAHLGTTIEISVPVLIESVEVLHVETAGQTVSIPFLALGRAMRLGEGDVARSAEGESIVCDGQVVPLAGLGSILRRTPEAAGPQEGVTALVLDVGAGAAAITVDHLLSRERVVVRALPEVLGVVPVIMGAFLDSQGNPQLVLDPAGVIEMVRSGAARVARAAPSSRLPVLVIDDSLTTRMLEQGILEAAGYEVDTAASGEEALRKARQRRYGVFVVDVEMPGINGFEFVEATRADARLSQVPSIIVTSRDSGQDRAQGQRLGVKAYIVKGQFDEELLLRTIRGLIG